MKDVPVMDQLGNRLTVESLFEAVLANVNEGEAKAFCEVAQRAIGKAAIKGLAPWSWDEELRKIKKKVLERKEVPVMDQIV